MCATWCRNLDAVCVFLSFLKHEAVELLIHSCPLFTLCQWKEDKNRWLLFYKPEKFLQLHGIVSALNSPLLNIALDLISWTMLCFLVYPQYIQCFFFYMPEEDSRLRSLNLLASAKTSPDPAGGSAVNLLRWDGLTTADTPKPLQQFSITTLLACT